MTTYRHVATCTSTQDVARELIPELVDGEVVTVTADHQELGRGREGRTWHDDPGMSVLMSVARRGPLDASILAGLSLRVARSVAATIAAETEINVLVKMPNDLLVGTRKLAGVLVDSQTTGNVVDWVVVGLGLNVHGPRDELDGRALTTIEAEIGVADREVLTRLVDTAIRSELHQA